MANEKIHVSSVTFASGIKGYLYDKPHNQCPPRVEVNGTRFQLLPVRIDGRTGREMDGDRDHGMYYPAGETLEALIV